MTLFIVKAKETAHTGHYNTDSWKTVLNEEEIVCVTNNINYANRALSNYEIKNEKKLSELKLSFWFDDTLIGSDGTLRREISYSNGKSWEDDFEVEVTIHQIESNKMYIERSEK